MPTPPIPFTPGETHALKDWCYDPKITPQSPTPGAFVSLSYRHQHANGELNSLPWRLSIKNYTLTPTEQGVIHTKEKAEHILLTDDMILNIDAFLEECSLRYEAYHYFLYDCERILMM